HLGYPEPGEYSIKYRITDSFGAYSENYIHVTANYVTSQFPYWVQYYSEQTAVIHDPDVYDVFIRFNLTGDDETGAHANPSWVSVELIDGPGSIAEVQNQSWKY